jgi:transcriptional regulator
MYLPEQFHESRDEELHRILRDNPLGALVTHSAKGLDADHIPFEFDPAAGPMGTLRAHVARANPLCTEFRGGAEVLVIFRGAQGYISPNWYPTKHETHRHVPTWNYEVVHVHGHLRIVDDEKFLLGALGRLTRHHEAAEPQPWKMSQAPRDYMEARLREIVGIEIEVRQMTGKRKLSQNRSEVDFHGAANTLQERGHETLSSAMKSTRKGTPT